MLCKIVSIFDRPKIDHAWAKQFLTGQNDRRLPVSCLGPPSIIFKYQVDWINREILTVTILIQLVPIYLRLFTSKNVVTENRTRKTIEGGGAGLFSSWKNSFFSLKTEIFNDILSTPSLYSTCLKTLRAIIYTFIFLCFRVLRSVLFCLTIANSIIFFNDLLHAVKLRRK